MHVLVDPYISSHLFVDERAAILLIKSSTDITMTMTMTNSLFSDMSAHNSIVDYI